MEHDLIISNSDGSIIEKTDSIIAKFLKSAAGRQSLAQSMIQPLKTRLDYSSIARKALSVTPLPQGALPIYDKDQDDICKADSLGKFEHNVITGYSDGSIDRSSPIRGRRVVIPSFEIFSSPKIRISDIKQRRFNIIDRAVTKARQQIMAQEDEDIFKALDDLG